MSQIKIAPEKLQEVYQELIQRRLETIDILSKIEEPELILLKGHLLIEESLHALLSHKMQKPTAIENARLTFAQVISLVEGLYDGEDLGQTWLYTACRRLNRIRNRLAHSARPDGLEEETERFVDFVLMHVRYSDAYYTTPLRFAIGSVYANFAVLNALHKKIALMPGPLQGLSFDARVTFSKVLSGNGVKGQI